MLFVPITWRANFCARKFISFDALEHEKIPNDVEVSASRARAKPAAARSSASSQLAGRSSPSSRTSGVVSRAVPLAHLHQDRCRRAVGRQSDRIDRSIDRRLSSRDGSAPSRIPRRARPRGALRPGGALLPRLPADALVRDPPARDGGRLPDRAALAALRGADARGRARARVGAADPRRRRRARRRARRDARRPLGAAAASARSRPRSPASRS